MSKKEKDKLKKNNGKTKNIFKIIGKILLVIIILVIIIAAAVYLYINKKLGKIQQVDIKKDDLEISEDIQDNLSKYRNIVLFGIDSRSDDYGMGNRSDCIIINSINTETKEVRLVSVYRDTYLDIPGHGLDKITHAYSFGTANLAMDSLNKNLDLNISEFVTVDFTALTDAIDKLGGIEINITDEEVKYINGYIKETAKISGKPANLITKGGIYNLDGVQAVGYSRIRYTAGGDDKRTERMRIVLEAMLKKVKTKSVNEINDFINLMLPNISTNISKNEMLKVISEIKQYKITYSIGWPYDVKGITIDRWYGVPVTLESNVQRLHEELFDEKNYDVSDRVKEINNNIITKTGYKK